MEPVFSLPHKTPTAPPIGENLWIAAAPSLRQSLRQKARQLHALGINVIPLEGHKRPIIRWRMWKTTRQTRADVEAMPWEKARGIAVVCGTVSGGLVCFDLDRQLDRAALDLILSVMNLSPDYAWQERTPGGGYHVYLICPNFTPPADAKAGKVDRVGRQAGHIEARLEGVLTTFYLDVVPSGLPATVDGPQFGDGYDKVTVKPPPEDHPASKPCRRSDPPPADYANLYEAWCLYVEREAVRRWGLEPPNSQGYSQMIPCPFHKETKASTHWNYRTHGLHCFGACGKEYTTKEAAEFLGLDSRETWKEAQRPLRTSGRKTSTASDDWWPHGAPARRLIERFLTMHRDPWLAETPNHGAAADGYNAWLEAINTGLLRRDQPVSVPELQAAGQQIGRNVTRATWETCVEQLTGIELCGKIDTYATEDSVPVKNSALIRRGKPARYLYQLRPLSEAIPDLLKKLAYRLYERAYEGVPVHFRPEFNPDLTAEDIIRLEENDVPLLQEYAPQCQRAGKLYAERLAIFEVKYNLSALLKDDPFTLPAGRETPNARAFRQAFYAADLDAAGGGRDHAYRAAWSLGVSRQTLAAYRDRENVLTVENYDEIDIDPNGDLDVLSQIVVHDSHAPERGYGVTLVAENSAQIAVDANSPADYDAWVADHQGVSVVARIRRANSEKRAELATDEQRAAFKNRREARQTKARQRQLGKTTRYQEKPAAIWENYSDPFIAAQAMMRLPQHISFDGKTIVNTRTGEVYTSTPRNLWRALADDLRPPTIETLVSEGVNDMPSVAYTEPHESEEDEPEDRLVCDPSPPSDLPLWQLTGVTEKTARAHRCEYCGQPAAGVNFIGGWRCETHWRAPLRLDRPRPMQPARIEYQEAAR